jgi:hypothetical protein
MPIEHFGFQLERAALRGEFQSALDDMYRPVADAATTAVRVAGGRLKVEGRASIAAAGFSKRWQNAFRVQAFPKGNKTSINAAAFAWHKIGYAGVFETGATILGKPLMWLPASDIPKKIGREKMTPQLYEARVGPLSYAKSPKGTPMLVARARVGRNAKKVSLAALRRGTTGAKGVVRSVPVFIGVKRVTIPKKFTIAAVAERIVADLPALYAQNFRDE